MINQFTEYLRKNRRVSVHTSSAYEQDTRAFAKWASTHLTDARWSTITQNDLETWLRSLTDQGQSPASIRRRIASVRQFFKWACNHGLLTNNPAQWLQSPKVGHQLPKTLAWEEVRATIYDKSIAEETRGVIAMMAETGMRIGEVTSLDWQDINLETGAMRVHGKGNKERIVKAGRLTIAWLTKQGNKTGKVLNVTDDRPLRYNIHCALRQHTNATKCSAHIVRHTFAVAHLHAGTDLVSLSRMMGHNDVKTTAIYGEVAGQQLLSTFNNITL